MDASDITIEILKDIREEIRTTNKRVDALDEGVRGELRGLGERMDRLERRVVEGEMRTATALLEVNGTMRDVRDLLRDRFDLGDRVGKCEREIDELKQRLPPAR